MADGFISNVSVWQRTTFQMAFGIAVELAQQQRHTTSIVSAKHMPKMHQWSNVATRHARIGGSMHCALDWRQTNCQKKVSDLLNNKRHFASTNNFNN